MTEGWDIEKAIQDIKRRCHHKPYKSDFLGFDTVDQFKSPEKHISDGDIKSELNFSEVVDNEILQSPSLNVQEGQIIQTGGKLFQAIPVTFMQPMTVMPQTVQLVKPDFQVAQELQEQQKQQTMGDEQTNINSESSSYSPLVERIFYVGRAFTSFKDLCEAKEIYEHQNKIVLSIRNSQTIMTDYKRCNRKNTDYNEELKYTEIAYQCRFGGKFRKDRIRKRKDKSSEFYKNAEPKKERNTISMCTYCPFSIKLGISKDNQSLRVVKIQEEHNHTISPSVYNKVRQKLDEETIEETKMLLSLNVDKNKIQQYLCSKGKMIRKKELFNLMMSVKKEKNQLILSTKFKDTMKDLHNLMINEDKGSNSFEDVLALFMNHHDISFEMMITNESVCGGIFFQTEDMKVTFDTSSEMLVFDTTYKLDEHRMSLYVILCLDGNGESMVIALALVQFENKETLSWIAESFRKYNPNFTKVKYVVADKDMLERQELLNHFPNAQLLNCKFFYTLKIFKKEVTMTKMNISAEERDFSLEMFQNIVSAKDKVTRDSNITLLEEMAPERVVIYFTKSWEPIKDDWARGLPRQSTINTLEIFNGRLKKITESYSSVTQFVTDLLILNWEHKWKRNQREFKTLNTSN